MAANELHDAAIDWSLTTWQGARREQLRRWLERYLKGTSGAPVTGVQGISYTQR